MKIQDLVVDEGIPKGKAGWSFSYQAEDLLAASERQAKFHREREAFYTEQATEIEATLREKGVELREQNITGGPRFAAVVDPEIADQLATARQKRDLHASKAKRFEAYSGVFGRPTNTTSYSLTIEDVDYFALHRDPGD